MKLPNGDKAIIPKDKLTDYLLSEIHTDGKSKAKFFRKFGFNEANVNLLEKSLLKIAKSEDIIDEITSLFGIKYVVDGKLKNPAKKAVQVRTIWIIEKGQNRPRFITGYPV